MYFNIFLILLTLWAAVYSVSYGIALFRNKNIAGGLFVIFLPLTAIALCFSYIFRIFLL